MFFNGKQCIFLLFTCCCLCWAPTLIKAQKNKADSILVLLASEKTDSNRVKRLWKLSDYVSIYNPDTALIIAQQAYYLARSIKYTEGESRSLGIIANSFIKMGNYPRALDINLQKLKLEEQRNTPRNMASVLMNIGIVYTYLEDYNNALKYYYQSDSVLKANNITELDYYVNLNVGDAYNRLNQTDSAYKYFNQSLRVAQQLHDGDLTGTSMTGLAHIFLKRKEWNAAQINYQQAIALLEAANDDEVLGEASLGLANLYQQKNQHDSAIYFARFSRQVANRGGFSTHELKATEFLTRQYQDIKNIDSAFIYLALEKQLNDSINSKARIRESQILSTNEQLRQAELEENRKIAAKERKQQLQLLLIGLFIPAFFLITVLLSRIRIHVRVIKVLGILSLLIFFEYLTLFLHPTVAALTHHTPVYEIMIFVAIAAFLIPAHHRIEHWLIEKLTHKRQQDGSIKITTRKIKLDVGADDTEEGEV
jgi:tetratricopeptide (TPR) repeat protein